MNITAIQPVQPLDAGIAPTASVSPASANFLELLHSAYSRVEHSGAEASRMVESFLSGDTHDLHGVAIATQKASLEFEMMLQARNKIVQAYQEVMRMQL